METYGGRLTSSTRSRAVKNSHGTAAAMLEKEEKYLDKLKHSSQRSLGREEAKLKKRLEKLELDRNKSPSRSYLDQNRDEDTAQDKSPAGRVRSRHERGSLQLQGGVDILSKSGTSVAGAPHSGVALSRGQTRRESLPSSGGSRIDVDAKARERAMSLAPGAQDILKKKSVTFGAQAKLCLNEKKLPMIVPYIHVSTEDDEDRESMMSIDSPAVSRHGADKLPSRKSDPNSSKKTSGSDQLTGEVGNDISRSMYTMAAKAIETSNDMESNPSLHVKRDNQQPVSSPNLRSRGSRSGAATNIPSGSSVTKATLDLKALKELEELLKDSRSYTNKKYRQLDIGPDSSTMRLQKKRMSQLEQLLTSLKPTQRKEPPTVEFDPMEVLNCSYLRLSKHNVEALEQMVRESGRDPGIHPHSDVSQFRLFEDKPSKEQV